MPLKALIFDFDLTLADATQGIYQCMNHALNFFGYNHADFETVKRTIGYTLPVSFQMLTGNNDPEASEKFVEEYVAHADIVMNINTFVYPSVFNIMPKIKQQGLQTAIVSTKYRYRIAEILKRDKLEEYFNCVIGGEDVKNHKPAPEGLFIAVEKLGLNKSETLYIGDSLVDAQAAKNAGIRFCAVLSGTTTADEFKKVKVEHIVENLEDVFVVLHFITE
jgi:phosphoglycolate phosphatase